jgi:hypothetical protein
VLIELIRALLAAAAVALLPGWFWSRVLLANSSSSSSSDLYERITYSIALSMALVPAIALIPTRLFGMGVSLTVSVVCVGVVFFSGLGLYLLVGSVKSATTEEPLASPPAMLGMLTLVLLVVVFGMGLGVLAGVVPGVPIRPPTTVGLMPSTGVMFASALLVIFAGLVYLVESRPEPQAWSTGFRRPSVDLAQRLLLPAVLVLALLRGYLGPILHDWPFIRGVDHYSHAVMAQLVMSEGKIEPYLIYPPGFHTITAMICRLTALEPLELFPVAAPLLLLLPALALYVLGRRMWGWHYGVAAALFSILLGGIYYYYNDAMYPNLVAAQFLMVVAVAALVGVYASPSIRSGMLFAILGSSVVLYHQVSSLYLAALLAVVGVLFVPYLLARDRRRGVVLLWSLSLLGLLSVIYAWDTYDLPRLVAGLVGESETGRGGEAVAMAIGTKPAYDLGHLLATTSRPVVWLGIFGVVLVAGELLRRRVGVPQTLAYLTLIFWVALLFVGSRTPLSGFPDRFERDLGIPLAVFAAFGLLAILRSLGARKPAAFAALLVVLLAGTLVGVQAVRSLEQAAGPSPRLKDRPPPPAVAAAGGWLEEHNNGGNIVVTPYLAYVPSRGMLAMGDYTGMQSYAAARIRRGRDLPPFGAGPLWDALWVLQHPGGERTRQIMEENDIRYVVFYKRYPTIDWRSFARQKELYRVAFENESVIIFQPR